MVRARSSTARRVIIALTAVALVPLAAVVLPSGAQPVSGGGAVSIGPGTGLASPAPSNLAVSGLSGAISDLEVTITNFSHTFPDDVDIMLESPGGQRAMLMSDVGGSTDAVGLTFTFDDEAPGAMADGGPLASGRFRLSDIGNTDSLPAPAPARPYASTLGVFDGTSPNGTWQLWVADDLGGDAGSFASWSLKIDVGPTGGPLTIPSGAPATTSGPAAPYPSNVNVVGLLGNVTDVNVSFEDLNHTFLDDLDVLLVAPTGATAVLMSDVGGSNDAVFLDLTLDDEAAAPMPDSAAIARGAHQPTNVGAGDPFAAPAPAGPHGTSLAAFDGIDPNGTWSLFVVDDVGGDTGNLRAWSLEIATAAPPATTTTTITPPADPCAGFPDRFTDDENNVHEERINCMAGLGLTEGGPGGLPPTMYGPAFNVTRAQMASFMARTIEHEGIALPANPPDAFSDDNTSVHQLRINQLAAVGVIGGNGESGSSYFPSRAITRGEMASFLNQAHRVITGALLPPAPDQFPDDTGSPYEGDINSLFAVDIVQGRTNGTYAPLAAVRRDAMASFIIRLVRYVETGTAGG